MEITQDKIDLISRIIKNDRKYPNNEDLYDDFFNETCERSGAIFESIDNPAILETYLRRVVTTAIINVLKDSGRLRRSKSGYVPVKEVSLNTVTDVIPSVAPTTAISENVSGNPAPENEIAPDFQNSELEKSTSDYSEVEDPFDFDSFDNTEDSDKQDNTEENDISPQDVTFEEFFNSDESITPEPQPEISLNEDFFTNSDTEEELIPENIDLGNINPEQETINNIDDNSSYNISYANIEIPPTPEDVAIQKEALKFVADTIKKIDEDNKSKDYMRIFMLRYDNGMTQKEIAQELGISQPEVSKRLFALISKLKEFIEN